MPLRPFLIDDSETRRDTLFLRYTRHLTRNVALQLSNGRNVELPSERHERVSQKRVRLNGKETHLADVDRLEPPRDLLQWWLTGPKVISRLGRDMLSYQDAEFAREATQAASCSSKSQVSNRLTAFGSRRGGSNRSARFTCF